MKIIKARNLLLDGEIEADDFKALKLDCEEKILRLEAKLANVSSMPLMRIGMETLVDKAITSFSKIDELFLSAEVKKQRHMVCSLFPDKLEYDGERFRTLRPNVITDLILLINNELSANKQGKYCSFSNLILMVAKDYQCRTLLMSN